MRGDADTADLARFLAGDSRAFEAIVGRNQDRIYALCVRMLHDRDHAFDATQEAFVQAIRKARRFEGRALFSTWLYRIAINVCHDELRRRRRRPAASLERASGGPVQVADPAAAGAMEAAGLRPDLEAALAALSPEFRATVVLCDVEGFGYEEAAQILDVAVGTIKSRLSRARADLARRLGNDSPDARRQRGTNP